MFILQPNPIPNPEDYIIDPWFMPYLLAFVLVGVLVYLFRLFEYGYATRFSRPFYRNLFVYRKLDEDQVEIVKNTLPFYPDLSKRAKNEFQHRIATFIKTKEFIGMEELVVSEEMKIRLSSFAVLLSFGRKYFTYKLIERILIFPDTFYNEKQDEYHKGSFMPVAKTIAFSWEDIKGIKLSDKRNLAIHEFMHALQWESKVIKNLDSERFAKYYKKILQLLMNEDIKANIQKMSFRSYAFVNEFEFMSELAEFYFSSPREFKENLPELYRYMKIILNIDLLEWE